jgi:hypothetical protein
MSYTFLPFVPGCNFAQFSGNLMVGLFCLAAPLMALLLCAVHLLTDVALWRIWRISKKEIAPYFPQCMPVDLQAHGRVGSAIVSMILGSPFIDMAETVSSCYVVGKVKRVGTDIYSQLFYVVARKIVAGRR